LALQRHLAAFLALLAGSKDNDDGNSGICGVGGDGDEDDGEDYCGCGGRHVMSEGNSSIIFYDGSDGCNSKSAAALAAMPSGY
jgi:hypothetical protein